MQECTREGIAYTGRERNGLDIAAVSFSIHPITNIRALIYRDRGTVAAILEGASGTASDFIRTCILLFVTHPWVQKKAQEELDRVVGTGRFPTLQDYENLPYCRAVVSEVRDPFVHKDRLMIPFDSRSTVIDQ